MYIEDPRFGERSSHFPFLVWFVLFYVYQSPTEKWTSQSEGVKYTGWVTQLMKELGSQRMVENTEISTGRRLLPSLKWRIKACGIQETWQDCLACVGLWRTLSHTEDAAPDSERTEVTGLLYSLCPPISH